ncbi:MAG: Cupin 2 conserved barrel domain protein [Edaphobacter sp.]|nr:Cupin 2 conserved barrel domain protein [Edaphobacter sp.]
MKVHLSVCFVFFSLAGMGGGVAGAQTVASAGPKVLSQAEVLVFDQMPANKTASGGESRNLQHGALTTGETVALHESMLPAGSVSGPQQHVIQHSELIVVREGTVMFEHGDKADKAGPGDVIYVAFGTMHRLRNVGDAPAKYVVIAIGGDTKK